jgi:hypothetical protein
MKAFNVASCRQHSVMQIPTKENQEVANGGRFEEVASTGKFHLPRILLTFSIRPFILLSSALESFQASPGMDDEGLQVIDATCIPQSLPRWFR